ncbi:MAG: ABC transporter ATP-binding protein [Reyranellaceae bacterium]
MHYTLPDGSARPVLRDISFDVAPGQFVAVIGQSGCGKTTLLRLLMGLARPTAGTIEILGSAAGAGDRSCAMVFQHADLLPWRTAQGNVEFGLEVAGVAAGERRRVAERMLAQVGLAGAARLRPHQLSGGMRQRVGLARALATDPGILLMDEPFGALDAFTRGGLQAELNQLHEQTGKTVIFVTHDVDEAAVLADRIVLLTPTGAMGSDIATGLPRPRGDLERLRTLAAFADVRYQAAQLLRPQAAGPAGAR